MQPCLDTLLRSFRLLSAHTWTKEWNDEEKDQPGSPAGATVSDAVEGSGGLHKDLGDGRWTP